MAHKFTRNNQHVTARVGYNNVFYFSKGKRSCFTLQCFSDFVETHNLGLLRLANINTVLELFYDKVVCGYVIKSNPKIKEIRWYL